MLKKKAGFFLSPSFLQQSWFMLSVDMPKQRQKDTTGQEWKAYIHRGRTLLNRGAPFNVLQLKPPVNLRSEQERFLLQTEWQAECARKTTAQSFPWLKSSVEEQSRLQRLLRAAVPYTWTFSLHGTKKWICQLHVFVKVLHTSRVWQ